MSFALAQELKKAGCVPKTNINAVYNETDAANSRSSRYPSGIRPAAVE
jgi:hypothetical protein